MKSVCKGMILIGLFGVFEVGCVAQKADVARIQKDLEQQIGQVKSKTIDLEKQIKGNRSAIAESQSLNAAQKVDMNKMRSDLASLNQQHNLLREQDLTSLYGQIEVATKTISDLQKDFDAHKNNFSTRTGTLQSDIQSIKTTMKSHKEQLQRSQATTTVLAQQIDEKNQAITKQLTDFQTAFGEFKHTLTDIGTELTTETQRASFADTQLSADITNQVQQVSTDLATQQQALQVRSDDLSQSIIQLQEILKQSGMLFDTRLDEQIAEQATHQTEFRQQLASLHNKLNTDTQALRAFLEQDVKAAMDQLVTDMDDRQRPVIQNIDALQSDMEALGLHVQADATQIQELSQSVVQLREAQDVMGSLLGKRGDEIIRQTGGLSELVKAIESHQTKLEQQLQSNTKKTSTHLAEVNAHFTSNSKRMDQATQSLAQRLTQQEKVVASLNQGIQQLEQFKDKTEGQIQQMQTSSQFADQLRQSVEKVNSRLQDLENHQSGLDSKLDSDVQTVNTSFQDVHNGIHVLKQELENIGTKLSTRIANQEQKLNRAMTRFQRVQDTATEVQGNVRELNALRETMSQLKEAFNTIGTKLGERVDEHEDRLGQLAQRVNRLGSKRNE